MSYYESFNCLRAERVGLNEIRLKFSFLREFLCHFFEYIEFVLSARKYKMRLGMIRLDTCV